MENTKKNTIEEKVEIAKSRAAANVRSKALEEGRIATDEEIRVAVLRAEANVISAELKKKVEEESKVQEAPVAEEPITQETPVAEEPIAQEAPVAEESKVQEESVTEEISANDSEDDDWLSELVGEPDLKKDSSKDQKEVSEEKDSETKVSEEEMEEFGVFDVEEEPAPSKNKKTVGFIILISVLIIGLIAIMIAAGVHKSDTSQDIPKDTSTDVSTDVPEDTSTDVSTDVPNDTSTDTSTDVSTDTSTVEFDINSFASSVVSIAEKEYGAENIEPNVNIFVKMIGADELKELIEKYDELTVKKSIAEFLIFVPEVKMQEYAKDLKYNPNAEDDCDAKLQEIDKIYTDATGKSADEVLMAKSWYNELKTSQALVKAKLVEENDQLLLNWYTARSDAYSLMWDQISDTEKAQDYRDSVVLELVSSEGAIDLWKVQLDKESKAELIVVDNTTKKFTDAYKAFVLNNYIYVVA